MPRITVKVGTTEPIHATISKATPLGALGTDAIAQVGPVIISGSAKALRRLADGLTEAADLADAYDQDPDGYTSGSATASSRRGSNRRSDRATMSL